VVTHSGKFNARYYGRLSPTRLFAIFTAPTTLSVDQGLKIVSLTFLFTDLKGSTELYARVGDLVAYELVRKHFHLLNAIVAAEGGAVVKTIGDAVMATEAYPALKSRHDRSPCIIGRI
jgi:class 3 adenylate cyclase